MSDLIATASPSGPSPAGAPATTTGGNYEVIRRRLLEKSQELRGRAETLNQRRKALFGGQELALLATERVRTENNCIPRDVASVGGNLLFGFQVFIGLKSETRVEDVFSLYRFVKTAEGYDLAAVPFDGNGDFLNDPDFRKQFGDVFRYEREPRLLQLIRKEQRLLFAVQIGATLHDAKVFRFSIDAQQRVKFMDARGEEDRVPPRPHAFEWTPATRDHQVAGPHPHINVLDQVFVETIGGDLTIKVENNTQDGKGIYREPVDDPNQSLDDAEIGYAQLGGLILLKVRPFREQQTRYLIFNTRTQHVVRVDSLGRSCAELPENHGILFPSGYYLQSGEYKLFDGESQDAQFERVLPSPNGEDVLYVFYRPEPGEYVLYPYNLIRKEIQTPLRCHGYCLFPDGTMLIFRESPSREPSRVHPVQIWQTPFTTADHAASAPTDGSYLAKVGNRDLVTALSEVLALCRAAENAAPGRAVFEELIRGVRRLQDTHYWLHHTEAEGLLPALQELGKAAELIVDEFEKQLAQEKRARDAVAQAANAQGALLERTRPTELKSVDAFLGALSDLKQQRGALISLKELSAVDGARVAELETEVTQRFSEVSQACVEFFLQAEAFAPLLTRLDTLVGDAERVEKSHEILPLREELLRVHDGLSLLAETVSSLNIRDTTLRTRILDGTSAAFAHENRARAVVEGRLTELATGEKRAEFAVQFKLLGQSVVSALGLANTPEACDEKLAALLLQIEELEGRFGELSEFAADIAQKREEVLDAVTARRQTLLEERQRRAGNLLAAAERMLNGIARRATALKTVDELNAYFASDATVAKVRELSTQLSELGDPVHAEELESKLKASRQNAQRALRDRSDLGGGSDHSIRLGRHEFQVNTQPLELTLVVRDGALHAHLTGTDYFEPLAHPELEALSEFWSQDLVSENASVYRAEFLAVSLFGAAERGESLSLDRLLLAQRENRLLECVRDWAAPRLDEGYERGVHDSDAAQILESLLGLARVAGRLRHSANARAAAWLFWANLPSGEQERWSRRARSAGRLRERLADDAATRALAESLRPLILADMIALGLEYGPAQAGFAARYLVDELAAERPRFTTSRAAEELSLRWLTELEARGARREFEDDLRALAGERGERLRAALHYFDAALRDPGDASLASLRLEVVARRLLDGQLEFELSSAATTSELNGLLGLHPRITARSLRIELAEVLERVERFASDVVPRYRAYRKLRTEAAEALRRRLRLDEFTPRVLSSFVRNRLIDDVYLPLVGANMAKQLGAAGDSKRTDLMGLLLLVSPPGYGKTTLMEYVAHKLGLVFMKINGPALGAEVRSLDPAEAGNATARQEVEKINLALRMGNNVMLYLDDIQHTHPELLQKFISLCDAQRKVEGVWNGQAQTYDLRGKRFCVVMAGNPYTETGVRFQIPDMLANRADTYNLGDILAGQADAFAQSYLENALTSNPSLAPLAGRDPDDLKKLLLLARGQDVALSDLSYAYSASEVEDITRVFQHLFHVQSVLLRVNQTYIASAAQDDQYRGEPAFKLQGSYRNMNKLAEKIVSALEPNEVEQLIDDHYRSEAQTLTKGAEHNLLKLAELRGRLTAEQSQRWNEIKQGFLSARRLGGKDDDPVARLTGGLLGLDAQLQGIRETLARAVDQAASMPPPIVESNGPALSELAHSLSELGRPKLEVQLAPQGDTELAQVAQAQLSLLAQAMAALTAGPAAPAVPSADSSHISAKLAELSATIDRLAGVVAQGGGVAREYEVGLAPHSKSNLLRSLSSRDVCERGGVFIATYDRAPPLGAPVRVAIAFSSGHRCQVEGRVRFHRDELGEDSPAGFGVEFTHVTPEARILIEAFARLREPWLRDDE